MLAIKKAVGRREQIAAIIAAASQPAPPEPISDQPPAPPDEDPTYYTEVHTETNTISDIFHLGLNDDLVWPGSLFQGSPIISRCTYVPIMVKRAPLTISLSIEGAPGIDTSLKETVSDPSLSNMRQGIANLLNRIYTGNQPNQPAVMFPAVADFAIEEVHSEEQMNARLGLAVSYGGASLKTNFEWGSTKQLTRLVATYKQVYFTVSIDTPAHPADLFSAKATPQDIQAAMPAGCMPFYVSSVSYGMMAMVCVESSERAEHVRAALDAAYNGVVDLKVNGEMTASQLLTQSKMKVLVYGGSTRGLNAIEQGYEGFLKVIHASSDFGPYSPGVPLTYRFHNVQDNSLATIELTSHYELRKPRSSRVVVTLDKMVCTVSDDEGQSNNADIDRFNVTVDAFNAVRNAAGGIDLVPIPLADKHLLAYANKDWISVPVDYVWKVGRQLVITFGADPKVYDFDQSMLVFAASARDYDTSSADEWGGGSLKLLGRQFMENGGCHTFLVESTDFTFEVYVTLAIAPPVM